MIEETLHRIKQGVSDDELRAILLELWSNGYDQGYSEGQYEA